MCSANDKVLSKMTPGLLANDSVGAIIPLCVCPLKFISTFVFSCSLLIAPAGFWPKPEEAP